MDVPFIEGDASKEFHDGAEDFVDCQVDARDAMLDETHRPGNELLAHLVPSLAGHKRVNGFVEHVDHAGTEVLDQRHGVPEQLE